MQTILLNADHDELNGREIKSRIGIGAEAFAFEKLIICQKLLGQNKRGNQMAVDWLIRLNLSSLQ